VSIHWTTLYVRHRRTKKWHRAVGVRRSTVKTQCGLFLGSVDSTRGDKYDQRRTWAGHPAALCATCRSAARARA
jgi:hypothetical protein